MLLAPLRDQNEGTQFRYAGTETMLSTKHMISSHRNTLFLKKIMISVATLRKFYDFRNNLICWNSHIQLIDQFGNYERN
jgi:hypothetical protein